MDEYQYDYEISDPYMERQGFFIPPWFWWLIFPPRPPFPPGPPMPGPGPRPPFPPGPPMPGPGPRPPFPPGGPMPRNDEDTTF